MIPKYFKPHELVPRATYERFGERSLWFIDFRLIHLIDALRERYGSATINNYMYGGDREWSGLRTPDSPYYSKYSQHSFGRAADIIFRDVTAEEIRKDILRTPDNWLDDMIPTITLEDDVSWLHIDLRNDAPGIHIFKP